MRGRRRGDKEAAGRANGTLNLLHIGGAFAIQSAIGFVVGLWPCDAQGRYPASAYEFVFAMLVVLQVAAVVWFLKPYWRASERSPIPDIASA